MHLPSSQDWWTCLHWPLYWVSATGSDGRMSPNIYTGQWPVASFFTFLWFILLFLTASPLLSSPYCFHEICLVIETRYLTAMGVEYTGQESVKSGDRDMCRASVWCSHWNHCLHLHNCSRFHCLRSNFLSVLRLSAPLSLRFIQALFSHISALLIHLASPLIAYQ
jgi:hypothetical protein